MKKGSIVGLILILIGTFVLFKGISGPATFNTQDHHYFEQSNDAIWSKLVQKDGTFLSHAKNKKILKTGPSETEWTEISDKNITYHYKLTQMSEEKTLRLTLLESSIGLYGTWIIQLTPKKEGTKVSIIESSTIQKKWVRIMMNMSGRKTMITAIYKQLEPE